MVFRDGSRTEAKSKMERFLLVINGWKPLIIVKKNLHINVYIVFIYINVELLSNVDKRNTLTSKKQQWRHVACEFNTFRNNPDQIPDRWRIIHISLLISTPDARLTLLLWKRTHILAKSAIFYMAVVLSTHLRGPTSMLIFWNYI